MLYALNELFFLCPCSSLQTKWCTQAILSDAIKRAGAWFAKIKYGKAWQIGYIQRYTLNEVDLPFYLFPNYPDHNNPELVNIFKSWESLRKTLNILVRVDIARIILYGVSDVGIAGQVAWAWLVQTGWQHARNSFDASCGSIASSGANAKNPAKPDTRKLGNALSAGQLNVKNLIETKWDGGVLSVDPIPAVVNDAPKYKEERKGRGSPRRSARETTELTTKTDKEHQNSLEKSSGRCEQENDQVPPRGRPLGALVRETGSVDNQAVGEPKKKEEMDTGSGDVVIFNQKCVTCSPEAVKLDDYNVMFSAGKVCGLGDRDGCRRMPMTEKGIEACWKRYYRISYTSTSHAKPQATPTPAQPISNSAKRHKPFSQANQRSLESVRPILTGSIPLQLSAYPEKVNESPSVDEVNGMRKRTRWFARPQNGCNPPT
ncbi:hypothetical protein DFH09DRAFT_1082319 [Mycena vulgaris]|nr:hypothetical protein DFH09DRAFT_1082319 [Mycena vulgaris]